MSKKLIRVEQGVELWCITHPADPQVQVFVIKDPSRTPQDWTAGELADAENIFRMRLENAKVEPPIR